MKIIITGAAGFVGAALSHYFLDHSLYELVLVDRSLSEFYKYRDQSRIRLVEGELQDLLTRREALKQGADILIHLAALPGGAAEEDPALSKIVNLDTTLALSEEFSKISTHRRFVFASTIAVLGSQFSEKADDFCPLSPSTVYGTHKAMVELALSDLARRGKLDPICLRLPGIVARPEAPSGLKSAFISNVFHVLKRKEQFVFPLAQSATTWLMSLDTCVKNIVHAATLASDQLPVSRAVTLRALHCSITELGCAITNHLGVSNELVSFDSDPKLELMFGRYPILTTALADRAGFKQDSDLNSLVISVFEGLKKQI